MLIDLHLAGWEHLCGSTVNDLWISISGKDFHLICCLEDFLLWQCNYNFFLFILLLAKQQENEYPGGLFVPMYDQTGAPIPTNPPSAEQNPNTSSEFRYFFLFKLYVNNGVSQFYLMTPRRFVSI